LLLLFGAEFTRVYANQYGSGVHPAAKAVPLSPEALTRQGIPRKEQVAAAQSAAGQQH
jgi:hypothetical protein